MVKKIGSKRIIELEALLNPRYYYVFRADGVDFKEFRVGNLNVNELGSLYQVYFELSKMVFKAFQWVKFIYFFDDEINLAFRGNQIEFGRSVQKNLSILSSYISVEFNRLIISTPFEHKLKRKHEYFFDGRFVEIDNIESLKEYFVYEQRKSHIQVMNLLTRLGVKGKKPRINSIISIYLDADEKSKEYKCLFGCFISRSLEEAKMGSNEESLVKEISVLIDKAFSNNTK